MPRSLPLLLLLLLATPAVRAQYAPPPLTPALVPASAGGVEVVDRALARLSGHRRLLVIGAHPDDEDTSLLSLVARGMGGEAAYLALSRGDGGQNLIGPELGVGLGVLRTGELLAARSIDGGRQFFTRAFDFGYTRSLDETLGLWPRPVLLEDAVRVIRRFRPQVVVSVFPGDARAGHGQHQAAGVIAGEAFAAAGDPAALPQLAAEGCLPWTPSILYRSTWWDREATTLELDTAGLEPLSGRSIFQIAMASRSQHRSQDMGRLLELGPRQSRVGWEAGAGGPTATDLFAGIDTRLRALAASLAPGEPRQEVEARLDRAQELATAARGALAPARLDDSVPAIAELLGELGRADAVLAGIGGDGATIARELLAEKLAMAQAALLAAAGVAVEAVADRETVTPGGKLQVTLQVWNAGRRQARWRGATLAGLAPRREAIDAPLAAGEAASRELAVEVPADAPSTLAYFLRRPLQGALYDWSEAPAAQRGEPLGPPALTARLELEVDGVAVGVEREVVYRALDQAAGEIRRPLRVVPALEVAVEPGLLVWPTADRAPRRLEILLRSNLDGPLSGTLELAVPAGWPAPPPLPFHIAEPRGGEVHRLPLEPPPRLVPGPFSLAVTARLAGGGVASLSLPVVDYPHVRPMAMLRPATVAGSAFDLALPRLGRVGYVPGASDRVPEFLREVGVPLVELGGRELAEGDLAVYDAIVVGSRAYETQPALGDANGRLLDYVRGGGLLIVQYQQYPFVTGGYAPYPLDIARPHDRITDETAAVRLLQPDHPAFQVPNRIGPDDWRGWVQERGLYFAHSFDDAYQPLLALSDPGGPELTGGLLVAPVGAGVYVYTGLAFFRQLPAGVAGAYRLFANLLALAPAAQHRGGRP